MYGNGLIEKIGMEGKKFAVITLGSVTGTVRECLPGDFGIIRVKAMRPFPSEDLLRACEGLTAAGVLEKDISAGHEGALYTEIKSALYGSGCRTKLSGFVAGLGGKDVTPKDLESVFQKVREGSTGTEWLV
jgi:pyruvate ferredoxin oxidoreductase alpha subunit